MKPFFMIPHELMFEPAWTTATPEQQAVFTILFSLAKYKEQAWEWRGQIYNLKPGQLITSVESIVQRQGGKLTRQKVRTALNRLEKLGFLTIETTNRSTIITIVNWDYYFGNGGEANQQNNHNLTNNQPTTNQQLTNNQPTTNQQLTTDYKYISKEDKREVEDTSEQTPSAKFDEGTQEYRLANYLQRKILQNLPKARVPELNPKALSGWSQQMDYMIRIDGRTVDEIKTLIDFATGHHFWFKNILSAAKLREQFDRVSAEMVEKPKENTGKSKPYAWFGYGKDKAGLAPSADYDDLDLYRVSYPPPTEAEIGGKAHELHSGPLDGQ